MAFIVPIFMLSIAYFTGLTVMKLFCDDKTSIIETCLVGTFFLMITSQVVVLICYYSGFTFSTYVRLMCMIMVLVLILSLFICQKDVLYHIKIRKKVNRNAVVVIVLMGAIEFLALLILMPDVAGDFTADAVNTLLTTDTIFGYDYLTGYPLSGEPSVKLQLDGLPFLYAGMAKIFHAKGITIVYDCAPIWAMTLCLMVYGLWAGALYGRDNNDELKRAIFVAGVCAVSICGAFSAKSLFYYQTFEGFRGEPICDGIIVPFCLYELFELYRNKKWQSVVYIVVAVLSAMLVTTPAKGLVPCAIIITAATVVALGYRLRRYVKCLQH
jgi:hypothetical protein